MVKRRDLKQVHEDAVLQQFSKYMENLGNTFNVLGTPDPPEAIIEINDKETWLEVTDAFLDKDHAIGLTTGVSEDVEHMGSSKNPTHPPHHPVKFDSSDHHLFCFQ